LCGYCRLDLSLIEHEIQPSGMPPFLKFVVVDVRPLVLRKPEQKYGAFAPAVRNQRAKSAALSLSWTCDALLDQPAAEVGIDQTAFGRQQGFDELPIRDAFAALKNGRSP
jgi:hypothetical protein